MPWYAMPVAEESPPHVCLPERRKFSGTCFCSCGKVYEEASVLEQIPGRKRKVLTAPLGEFPWRKR